MEIMNAQQSQTAALGKELEERLSQVRSRLADLRGELDDASTVEAGLEAAISTMHERRQTLQSQPMAAEVGGPTRF